MSNMLGVGDTELSKTPCSLRAFNLIQMRKKRERVMCFGLETPGTRREAPHSA